jgi:hypothetical protein
VRKSLIAATSMLVINLRAQEKHVLFAVENFLFFLRYAMDVRIVIVLICHHEWILL